jgi:predicted permease
MRWREWWRQIRRRDDLDGELQEEMRLHLEEKEEALRAAGMAAGEARVEARKAFGNVLQIAEEARWHWLPRWLDEARQDTRYALRTFRQNSGLAATVVVTMGLGIGANTAIFSMVEALLLRRLPVAEPGQLVEVKPKLRSPGVWTSEGENSWDLSYPLFREVQASQRSFSCLYGRTISRVEYADAGLGAWDTPPRAHFVSTCYFDAMGVAPVLGRTLRASDVNGTKAQPVAVLSHGLWKRRFSGDPGVVGRSFQAGPVRLEIVGVMPEWFVGDSPVQPADFWVPLEMFGGIHGFADWNRRNATWFQLMGRLRAGMTPEAAASELTGQLRNRVRTDLAAWKQNDPTNSVTPEMFWVETKAAPGGANSLRNRYQTALGLLMGVSALLLLLACLNVAGLLMARSAARQREMGVRRSLGATRGRLVRQLLMESLLLALVGALLGLLLGSQVAVRLAGMLTRSLEPLDVSFRINGTVLFFTLALTVAAALAAGLAPAWRSAGTGLAEQLSAAGRTVTQHRRRMVWNRSLVVAQVAIGVLLAAGAGLTLRSLYVLASQPNGYETEGVLVAFLSNRPQPPGTESAQAASTSNASVLLERLQEIPGVQSAALAEMAPMTGWMMMSSFHAQHMASSRVEALTNSVSPGYFETLRSGLIAGRSFVPSDNRPEARVCIIDEDAARQLFGERSPLGQFISRGRSYDTKTACQVVGVARAQQWSGPKHKKNMPYKAMVWFPLAQEEKAFRVALVRVPGNATEVAPAVRRLIEGTAPRLMVTQTVPLTRLWGDTVQRERLLAALCVVFGVVALGLVFAGLYGLLAYGVERRVPEIGVRVAMGATPGKVAGLIGREACWTIGLGLAGGVPLALGLSRTLRSLLWEIEPTDPWAYGMTVVVVLCTGLLALVRPARRAASVDPVAALRAE